MSGVVNSPKEVQKKFPEETAVWATDFIEYIKSLGFISYNYYFFSYVNIPRFDVMKSLWLYM